MEYIDLTGVCIAVLTVVFGLITYKVWPYAKELMNQKFTAQELEQIRKWIKIAVQAAEMIYHESGMGKDKKQYVVEFITEKLDNAKDYLEKHGFTINWDEINKMIESEVLELNKAKKN